MLLHKFCVCVCVYRCYAALGDVAKVRYLREVGKLAEKMGLETVSYTHYTSVDPLNKHNVEQ